MTVHAPPLVQRIAAAITIYGPRNGIRLGAAEINVVARLAGHAVATRAPDTELDALLVPPPADERQLTPRQFQVLALTAAGYTKHEIADALEITPDTVKNFRRQIYARLGAHDGVDAVMTAIARGDLDLPRILAIRAQRTAAVAQAA